MAGCTVLAMEVAAIIGTPKQNYTPLSHGTKAIKKGNKQRLWAGKEAIGRSNG